MYEVDARGLSCPEPLIPVSYTHLDVYKRQPEDNVKSFCDVAFLLADGKFPDKNVHRAINVHLPSGQAVSYTHLVLCLCPLFKLRSGTGGASAV